MIYSDIICRFLSVLSVVIFWWASKRFFNLNYKQSEQGLLTIACTFLCSTLSVQTAEFYSKSGSVFAICLYAISLTLFLSSTITAKKKTLTIAFSQDIPTLLISKGPYRFIRHPFYTSYIITMLANFILAPSIATFFALVILSLVLQTAAQDEENKFQNSYLRTAYLDYKQKTGMFFPFLNFNKHKNI